MISRSFRSVMTKLGFIISWLFSYGENLEKIMAVLKFSLFFLLLGKWKLKLKSKQKVNSKTNSPSNCPGSFMNYDVAPLGRRSVFWQLSEAKLVRKFVARSCISDCIVSCNIDVHVKFFNSLVRLLEARDGSLLFQRKLRSDQLCFCPAFVLFRGIKKVQGSKTLEGLNGL